MESGIYGVMQGWSLLANFRGRMPGFYIGYYFWVLCHLLRKVRMYSVLFQGIFYRRKQS